MYMPTLVPDSNESKQLVTICGPICESADVFASNYPLEDVKENDVLVIEACGAYGRVMAMTYNQRPIAAEYVI